MFVRSLLGLALAASTAEAFMGASPMPLRRANLRAGACTGLRMVDWSEPKDEYTGTGAEVGQINKSADIEKEYEQRLADAREKVKEAGTGWKSEYDPTGKLKEGDRDPMSGRLILDPLKVPTSEQGAPASFAEYMERRAKKEGGHVLDIAGNDVTDIRPTAPVHQGSWGPVEGKKGKDEFDQLFGAKKVDTSGTLTDEQIEWNKKREEERLQQEAETEARMQKWVAEAAAKKAAGN